MGGRAIVLGAGGFVGRRVVDGLVRDGWYVTAATRQRGCPWLGLDHVICDAADSETLLHAADGMDCLVNATAGNFGTA